MTAVVSRLGLYLVPVAIGVFEILLALILLALLRRFGIRGKRRRSVGRGEAIYCNVIGRSAEQMHLILQKGTRRVLFMTDNVRELTDFKGNVLSANLENLSHCMQKKVGDLYCEKFRAWKEDEPFSFLYQDVTRETWMELSIHECLETQYHLVEIKDVTAEKDREALLEQKIREAEDISESKTFFLSRMSHEIRTPMNGIKGLITLLKKQPQSEDAKDLLKEMDSLTAYMISLINDILDISRIENGKLELENKPFDILEIASEVQSMFGRNIEKKGVRFVTNVDDFRHRYVVGDRLRISQVVANLVSNAAKFTQQGEVAVTFKEMLFDGDKVSFMIEVRDTGKGMSPRFLSRMFRPFEQENAGIAGTYGGSGLGLSITDQIVRLMGGEIVVDSYPDKGSDFKIYLSLPFAKEASEAPPAPAMQELISEPAADEAQEENTFRFAGKHILMAEDNEVNIQIAVAILTDMGAHVTVARNGGEVTQMFAEKPAGTYDFILMDIQMPVMNGREATKTIRAMARPDGKTIPIFGLSADAFVEDKRLSEDAGMNGHFAKPIDFDELEIQIGKTLKRGTHA